MLAGLKEPLCLAFHESIIKLSKSAKL